MGLPPCALREGDVRVTVHSRPTAPQAPDGHVITRGREGERREARRMATSTCVCFGDALEVVVAGRHAAKGAAFLCSAQHINLAGGPPIEPRDLCVSLGTRAVAATGAVCARPAAAGGESVWLRRLPDAPSPPPLLRAGWLQLERGGGADLTPAIRSRLSLHAHRMLDGQLLCAGASIALAGAGVGGATCTLTTLKIASVGGGGGASAARLVVGRVTGRTQIHIEAAADPPADDSKAQSSAADADAAASAPAQAAALAPHTLGSPVGRSLCRSSA